MTTSMLRTRWAAIGAAVAVTLGAGGIGISYATNPAGAAAYIPITPCRLADTRPAPDNVGPRSTPIGAAETVTISAHGNNGQCTGIPASATGLQLNVTAIGATSGSFLTIWATGGTKPTASSLNPQPGAPPIPNAVTTGLSSGGQFDIFNNAGSVNVLVDVVGYYADHDHDDRYYTKAEVDTAVASVLDPIAAGFVNADGSLSRSVGTAVTTTWNAGNSRYEITLAGESYFYNEYATVVTTICGAYSARSSSVGGKLLVYVYNTLDAAAQCDFAFVVHKL